MNQEQDYITGRRQEIDLCVVIPMRNEEAGIVAVVEELCTALVAIPTMRQVHLLIVDDFSQDNGVELLKQWFHEQQPRGFSLTIIRLQHRHAVGDALLKGFKLAATWSPHLTLVMDADGQHDPSFIAKMILQTASTDVVNVLRGKQGESFFFRFCYTSFQLFMKLTTGSSTCANQFCVMKLPVLLHLSSVNHIDYLGALLNNLPFSRYDLDSATRARIAGYSNLNFFDRALTAAIIVSYHPRLLTKIHHAILLLLVVLFIVVGVATSYTAIIMLMLYAILAHFWYLLLTKILLKRAVAGPLKSDAQVEEIGVDSDTFAWTKKI